MLFTSSSCPMFSKSSGSVSPMLFQASRKPSPYSMKFKQYSISPCCTALFPSVKHFSMLYCTFPCRMCVSVCVYMVNCKTAWKLQNCLDCRTAWKLINSLEIAELFENCRTAWKFQNSMEIAALFGTCKLHGTCRAV